MKKKFLWMILAIVVVFGLAACMPGTGGGGTVYIDGVAVGAGGGQAAAPAAGAGTTAPAAGATQQEAQPGGMGDMFTLILPFVLMFAVVYFLIMRPQRKQAKATKEMQEGLRPGDNVMTTSGFFGKIVGEGTDCFLVEFGQDRGIKVWVRKTDIAGVRSPVMTPPPKGDEPVKEIEDKGKKDKKKD